MRSVSSLVLPEPAEAVTKAETAGSEASRWRAAAMSRAWVIGATLPARAAGASVPPHSAMKFASVLLRSSSSVTPGAISTSFT